MIADRLATRLRPGWADPANVSGGSLAHKFARRLFPLPARWALARLRWDSADYLRDAARSAQTLGWPTAVNLRLARVSARCSNGRRVRPVRVPGYPHPLFVRDGTSDARVLEQVFGRKEYACVGDLPSVRVIVDGGANVGYTSAYLLNRYPHARLIAVEPDAGNLTICRRNLAPFGSRVQFVHAGIWNEAGPMVVERTGEEWAFTIRPAHRNESSEFQAVTMDDMLRQVGRSRIDLLKLDIEGAEERVFTNAPWLDRVNNLVIELHGESCERSVSQAMSRYRFDRSMSGELTVFRNLQPVSGREAGP